MKNSNERGNHLIALSYSYKIVPYHTRIPLFFFYPSSKSVTPPLTSLVAPRTPTTTVTNVFFFLERCISPNILTDNNYKSWFDWNGHILVLNERKRRRCCSQHFALLFLDRFSTIDCHNLCIFIFCDVLSVIAWSLRVNNNNFWLYMQRIKLLFTPRT